VSAMARATYAALGSNVLARGMTLILGAAAGRDQR
jgi:hypothetical protein